MTGDAGCTRTLSIVAVSISAPEIVLPPSKVVSTGPAAASFVG